MKKIINNKLYDTSKAELVLEYWKVQRVQSLIGRFDKNVECELYKTSKGAWFGIVGADMNNPLWVVMTEEEAKETIKIDPDKYQELYKDVEEA